MSCRESILESRSKRGYGRHRYKPVNGRAVNGRVRDGRARNAAMAICVTILDVTIRDSNSDQHDYLWLRETKSVCNVFATCYIIK